METTNYKKADVKIVDYTSDHKKRFIEINEAWITKDFVLEEIDKRELYNPEENILKGGGAILIALHKNEPIGTCALVNMGNGEYELIKMAVDEKARGLKIGKLLGLKALERAKFLGAKKVILHSNTKFSAIAIQLYIKLGFKEIPLIKSEFERANIKMEINFK
jgi:ribosomal protein S18 acetylase RimI-like enzyme